jgi:hypothetical protein
MTDEDWKYVENNLQHEWHTVTLLCDGYRLELALMRVTEMSLGICVYINGWWRGEWILNDCEERRRFMRPVVQSMCTGKIRKAMLKLPKKYQKKMEIDKTYTSYRSHWTSFKSLKRHLIKNNESIELVRDSDGSQVTSNG